MMGHKVDRHSSGDDRGQRYMVALVITDEGQVNYSTPCVGSDPFGNNELGVRVKFILNSHQFP
jgi:hypothetical protein